MTSRTPPNPVADAVLAALADGSARPIGELARLAHTNAAAVRRAIDTLKASGELTRVAEGRHSYLRLTTPPAHAAPAPKLRPRGMTVAMLAARTCYGHLAGQLGVAWCARLAALGAVATANDVLRLTPAGRRTLQAAGLALDADTTQSEGKACLDGSERHPHIGGALSRNLTAALLAAGWIETRASSRALTVTTRGRASFARLGVTVATR